MLPTSSVRGNSIGDVGARAIAEALKHNSSITSLSWVFRWKCCAAFFVGDFSSDVVPFCCGPMLLRCVLSRASLAERLTCRPILLSTSSVGVNSVGEAGARAIAEALKHNSSITSLEWVFRWKCCAAFFVGDFSCDVVPFCCGPGYVGVVFCGAHHWLDGLHVGRSYSPPQRWRQQHWRSGCEGHCRGPQAQQQHHQPQVGIPLEVLCCFLCGRSLL